MATSIPIQPSIELYRVYHGCIQKLSPLISMLHTSAAFLLINYPNKTVYAWLGKNSSSFDQIFIQNIGHKILYEEFKLSTLSNPLIVIHQTDGNGNGKGNETDQTSSSSSSSSKQNNLLLLRFFNLSSNELENEKNENQSSLPTLSSASLSSIPSTLQLLNDIIYLSELNLNSILDNTSTNDLISIQFKQSYSLNLNSSKISYTPLTSDTILLYECGQYERYLWIGKKILRKFHLELYNYAKNHSQSSLILNEAPLIVIRDGMEPFLFLERFKNIQETFPKFKNARRNSEGTTAVKVVKKSIDGEIPRMISSGFGTLSVVSQGFGSDSATNGLKMEFVHDESSEVSLWKIDDKTRKFIIVQELERGIFFSNSCYALLYRCKNGARNILFLWIGDESRPDLRAALAIQWSTITPPNVAVDHVQVRQNSEPPIFSAICFHHFQCPLCVLDGFISPNPTVGTAVNTTTSENRLYHQYLVLEFYFRQLGLDGMKPSVVQTFPQVDETSFEDFLIRPSLRCRLTMKITSDSRNQFILSLHALKGNETNPLVSEAMNRIIDKSEIIVKTAVVVSAGQQDHVGDEDRTRVIVTRPEKTIFEIDSNIQTTLRSARPIRLFRVSLVRRNLGALFVEEIGIGGMFKQVDMEEAECYILDSGANVVYIWHGLESTYQGQALCTRVCQGYISELRKEHDICASPIFRSIFTLPADPNLEIRYLQSGHESADFIQLFPKWQYRKIISPMLCPSFDPAEITKDETNDEKYDRTGNLLDSNAKKGRYSDTSVLPDNHNRQGIDQRPSQPSDPWLPQKTVRPETNSQPAAYKTALKPVGDRNRATPVIQNEQSQSQSQVPEFVAKRNALKVVKCPDETAHSTPMDTSVAPTESFKNTPTRSPNKFHDSINSDAESDTRVVGDVPSSPIPVVSNSLTSESISLTETSPRSPTLNSTERIISQSIEKEEKVPSTIVQEEQIAGGCCTIQ